MDKFYSDYCKYYGITDCNDELRSYVYGIRLFSVKRRFSSNSGNIRSHTYG